MISWFRAARFLFTQYFTISRQRRQIQQFNHLEELPEATLIIDDEVVLYWPQGSKRCYSSKPEEEPNA